MPFGFHLAMDTLPSEELTSFFSQRGITPAFGYGPPHPSARRTSTFLNNALLSTHYRSVRLPRSVRHRRTSLDFPMRPKATAALGGLGISRFPCEVSAYVHGVSDRAGLWLTSRYRCTRCCLPLSPTASTSRSNRLTRLNTRPARSPVNASTPPSRAAPHDSGSMWVAKPLSYDFFIHYNLAGLTGAQEKRNENQSDQHIRGRPEQGPALLYGGTGLCQED